MRKMLREAMEKMKPKVVDAADWFTLFVALSIPLAQLLLSLFPLIFYVIGIL